MHKPSRILTFTILAISFMNGLLLEATCLATEAKPFSIKGSMCAATDDNWPMTITLVDIGSSLRGVDKNLVAIDIQGIPQNTKLVENISKMKLSGKCIKIALNAVIYKKKSFGYYGVFDSWDDQEYTKATVAQKKESPGNNLTENIEALLNEKRWSEAQHAADDLRKRMRQSDGVKWTIATNRAVSFLTGYEGCTKIENMASNETEVDNCYQFLMQNTWRDMNEYAKVFSPAYVEQLHQKRDIVQKKIDDKKQRKERDRAWQKEADELLSAAYEKATEESEYVVLKASCSICSLSEGKREIEKAIADEKSYSNKYGVINLSKMDNYKQQIMQIDQIVAENKKEYKKQTGKAFNASQCKSKKMTEDCEEGNQDKIYKQIALKMRDENLNQIQDQDKKSFMKNYLENKPSY
jgi:hypothetical protein